MSFAATLKRAFFHERHSRPDALPRSLIERFAAMPRLTGILPYVGWLPDERMFVLDQGGFGATEQFSIGFAIEIVPQTGATDEMEKILASLFISCPAETGIQVSLYASPDINQTLQAQTALIKNAELIDIAERRNKYYRSGTGKSLLANNSYLLRDFRCVISVSLPLSPFAPTEVEEAIRTRESVHATLRSAYLGGFDWTPDHLLNFVGDFFDHERLFNSDTDAKDRLVVKYNPDRIIREQLSNHEIASCVSDQGIRFCKSGGKETVMQLFSVRNYPKCSRLNHMGSMIGDPYQTALSMPCPFLITMGAIVQDHESARTYAQMKSARATQNAASYMAIFQPDLQNRKRDWDFVLKTFDEGKSTLRMYHQICLLSTVEDASRAEHAVKAVWRARGYAFLLAIKSSMPEMASLFEYLQDVANKVNGMNVNACKMTEGIPFVQGADLSKNMSAMFSHVAGSTSNMFPDSFDSWKQTKTDATAAEAAKAAAAASDPTKANYFKPGNVVWKALQNVTGIDDEDKRLIMSITGTIIITPAVPGGANGGSQPTWHYAQPTSIRVEDFIGDDPSTASTGVDVFVCDTTTDCLNPSVPAIKVSITPFVKKVSTSIDALRTGITTRATQNINDFKIVDASSVPVWKLLTTSTATNQPQMVDLYKRLIAVDIAYSYFNGLIKMASQSLANSESGAVPPDAQTAIAQLQTRLSNLSALVQTMRIAEYNKTSGEANLQRQIQLMHQAMVAGIPAQAFTSMTVFGSER